MLDSWQTDKTFRQTWLAGTGAPRLSIVEHALTPANKGYRLQLTLKQQAQADKVYPLALPLRIRFAEGQAEQVDTLQMTQATQTFTLSLPAKPLQIALDPEFDVFRLPDAAEMPASIGAMNGKSGKTYVLSRQTDATMQVAWESWLDTLKARDPQLRVQYDDAPLLAKLPHYGKYSYLVFNSVSGENVAKGQWEVTDSPLVVNF